MPPQQVIARLSQRLQHRPPSVIPPYITPPILFNDMPRILRIVNSAIASLTTKFQAVFGRQSAINGEQSSNHNAINIDQSNGTIEQATDISVDHHEEYEHSLRTLVDWRSETSTIVPTMSQHNMETIYEHDRVEEEVVE